MKIIIKPLGIVVILVAMACAMVFPRLWPLHNKTDGAQPAATDSALSSTAANILIPANWGMYTEHEARATQTTVNVTGQPFNTAYRFEIETIGKDPWNIGFHNRLDGVSFTNGEKVQVRLWARSEQQVPVTLMMQQSESPYAESWRKEFIPTAEWKEYVFDFDAATYAPGAAYLSFLLGKQKGTVDIADVRLIK